MNHRMIRYITGSLIQMEAAMLLVPALTALLYGEMYCLLVFLGTALFCVAGGQVLKGKKPEDVTIFSSEGYVSVAVCWIMLSICGAMPLYLSGYFSNPVDALFEIVSGFTTTGATVGSDVEKFFPLDWRYGSAGFYAGASSHGRGFQHVSDAGGEPGAFGWKAGAQGQKYGEDSVRDLLFYDSGRIFASGAGRVSFV